MNIRKILSVPLGVLSIYFSYRCFFEILSSGKFIFLFHFLSFLTSLAGCILLLSLKKIPFLETVCAFFIPCVGGPAAWLLCAGEITSPKKNLMKQYAEYIDARKRFADGRIDTDSFSQDPEPDFLEPMVDILNAQTDHEQKRIAVLGLYEMHTQESIELLRETLANPSLEVRIYAAEVLEKIEENMEKKIKLLEYEIAEGDTGEHACIELARTYFDYAYYNLSDEARIASNIEKAMTHACAAVQNGFDEGLIVSGRCCMLLRRYQEAESYFNEYLSKHPDNPRAALYRAEIHFLRRDFDKLGKECSAILSNSNVPYRLKSSVEMWAHYASMRSARKGAYNG